MGYDIVSLIMWTAQWYKVVTVLRGVAMATEAYMIYYVSLKDLVTLATSARHDIMLKFFAGFRLFIMAWLWQKVIRTEVIVFRRLATLTLNDAQNVLERLQHMSCALSKITSNTRRRLKRSGKLCLG